ncbi:hypothetical protein [Cognatiluteimonas profundi]|uniref:hypothetical protein n=1 Tax=Cognatiluteimonas profundi TaxID=2594501 RepID=UPI00131C4A0A|nr:hypothetical protein [Lysobacter profundi]
MRIARVPAPSTRTTGRLTALLLLMACLGACDQTAPRGASISAAATATPASVTTPAPRPVESAANAALAVAIASDQAARAAREQTLRVQRELVEQRRATRDAAQRGNGNERCLDGQKMRRVANGWVQAGAC